MPPGSHPTDIRSSLPLCPPLQTFWTPFHISFPLQLIYTFCYKWVWWLLMITTGQISSLKRFPWLKPYFNTHLKLNWVCLRESNVILNDKCFWRWEQLFNCQNVCLLWSTCEDILHRYCARASKCHSFDRFEENNTVFVCYLHFWLTFYWMFYWSFFLLCTCILVIFEGSAWKPCIQGMKAIEWMSPSLLSWSGVPEAFSASLFQHLMEISFNECQWLQASAIITKLSISLDATLYKHLVHFKKGRLTSMHFSGTTQLWLMCLLLLWAVM